MVYQGSKRQYAKFIKPILQQKIDETGGEFYDVMCGGCHIIEGITATSRHATDLNRDLIALYQYALDNPIWPNTITRENWDKAKLGEGEPWWRALVCFFASYSARGWSGGFCLNGTRDYYHERLRDFEKQLPLLQGIDFSCVNYLEQEFPKGSVIYIDPPYMNTKKYDINKNFDYTAFWNKVRQDSKDNYVYVSEQVAPEDFKAVWTKETNRNCFGAGLVKATENLFVMGS